MKKFKYREWIKRFENDDSHTGDLARDIKCDSSFPNTINYNISLNHLRDIGASEESIQALRESFRIYNVYLKE